MTCPISRKLPKLPIGFVIYILSSSIAISCTCPVRPTEEDYKDADIVVRGRIIERNDDYLRRPRCNPDYARTRPPDRESWIECSPLWTLRVEDSWKHEVTSRVKVTAGHGRGDCGLAFEKGRRYLLFLYAVRPGLYRTSICDGSVPLEFATRELEFLGRLENYKPKR